MTLKRAIDFVYSFYNETLPLVGEDMHDREFRDPKFTRELIQKVGIQVNRDKNILVVGSKGKGTTSTLLAKILESQGYKVGLFTSPHLERFTERVKINGIEIPEQTMIEYLLKLEPLANEISKNIPKPYYLGPNGIFLAMAMMYFEENQTDFNILESGRGGEFDDVYQMGNHVIITPIVLEHKYRLGPTLDDVIKTKTSVVDSSCKTVVVSKQDEWVYNEVLNKLPKGIDVYLYGKDHILQEHNVQGGFSDFKVKALNETISISLPSLAEYIGINLSSAIIMAKNLVGEMNYSNLQDLKEINFNGRCEIINSDPITVLDGMICKESASYVVEAIEKMDLNSKQKVALLAIPKDKDYLGVLEELGNYFDTIIFTKSIGAQYPFFQDFVDPRTFSINAYLIFTDCFDDAITQAHKLRPDLIGVFGTQSLIGEARKKIQKNV